MRRICVLSFCLCLAACGGRTHPHRTFLTSGQVLVNGQPAAGAEVSFHPQGDMGGNPYFPIALTNDEGKFILTTYEGEDGAPAGEYQVDITWPTFRRKLANGPDRLGGKYAKVATSGLKATVQADTVNLIKPFELTVDPAVIQRAEAAAEKESHKKGGKRKDR
jgi:hypothetical protein